MESLNIRTAIYDYFVTVGVGEFARAYASDCAHVTWSWHKRSHAKSNLIRNEHSLFSYCNSWAFINNVEVKNIKSAGCAGLTQLQRKLFQHLDSTPIFCCKRLNRTTIILLLLFLGSSPSVLLGVGYILKWLKT